MNLCGPTLLGRCSTLYRMLRFPQRDDGGRDLYFWKIEKQLDCSRIMFRNQIEEVTHAWSTKGTFKKINTIGNLANIDF